MKIATAVLVTIENMGTDKDCPDIKSDTPSPEKRSNFEILTEARLHKSNTLLFGALTHHQLHRQKNYQFMTWM